MKPIFLFLLFLCNILKADGFQMAVAAGGAIWSIYIAEKNEEIGMPYIKIEVVDSDGNAAEKIFIPPQGTEVSNPNIACHTEGFALAAWIEKDGSSSRCAAAYFDGNQWQKKKIISPKKFQADPLSLPAISLESSHDATIAYLAKDPKNRTYLLIQHYDDNEWSKNEIVTNSSHPLMFPALCLDPFGNHYIAWIDVAEKRIKIARNSDTLWDIFFEAAAEPLVLPSMSMSETGFVCAWLANETTIQSAHYQRDWSLLEPLKVEEKVSHIMLSYTNPLGYFMFWMNETFKNEDSSLKAAILNGQKWENIEIPDLENDDFNP